MGGEGNGLRECSPLIVIHILLLVGCPSQVLRLCRILSVSLIQGLIKILLKQKGTYTVYWGWVKKKPFQCHCGEKSSKINCVQIWLLRHEEPTKLRWTQLHQWYTMGDTVGNVISCTGMVQLEAQWYISCVGEVGVQLKMRLIASKGLPLQINQGVNCDGPLALHCSSVHFHSQCCWQFPLWSQVKAKTTGGK